MQFKSQNKNITSQYNIIVNNRVIAFAYISPHPYQKGKDVASIIPISRKGKWVDNTLEITFEELLSDIFDSTLSHEEMLNKLSSSALVKLNNFKIVRRVSL